MSNNQEKKPSLEPYVEEVLKKIGCQIKIIRENKNAINYKTFSEEILKMNKNTYHKMESGSGDYNISNLIKLIKRISDKKLSDFFADAGL